MAAAGPAAAAVAFTSPPPAAGRPAPVKIRAIGRVRIIAPRGHRPLYPAEKIRKFLRPFVGGTWDLADLGSRLERKYRFLGFFPEIEMRDLEGILDVTIREGRFVVSLVTREPAELDRIGVSSRRPEPPRGEEEPIPDWILRQNLITAEGDLQNLERYRQDRFQQASFGHHIAFIEGDLLPGAEIPSAAYLLIPRGPRRREPSPEGEEKPPPENNFIGGNLKYGPRRGFTLQAVYRKWRWLTPFDSLEVSPSYNGSGGGGELRYRANYLFSGSRIRRNLSTSLRLFSDLYPDRPFAGVESDERREGGEVALGVQLFPENKLHDLTARVEIERSRVSLDPAPPTGIIEDFTFLRLTGRYEFLHKFRPPSFRFRATPSVAWALEELGGDLSYVLGTLEGSVHGWLPGRWETDLHLMVGILDRQVPLSEELRMGGVQTVRGFQEDQFSGRRTISLQSELWFPLSTLPPDRHRFLGSLKGAVFLDLGTVSGGQVDPAEELLGLGAGIRFQVPRNPLLVKVDYGFGFLDGHSESHLYFGLALLY